MPGNSKPAIYRDPFKPGEDERRQRGRKLGSRAKLAKKFFEDTYAAWEEQGEAVLARAAFHDPVAFLGIVARLMPQKIEVSTPTDGMSDERLAELLDVAERLAGSTVIEHDPMSDNAHSRTQAALLSAHAADHENGLKTASAEEGGGGPLGCSGAGVVTSRHAPSAAAAKTADTTVALHNTLDVPAGGSATPNSSDATPPYPVGRPFPKPDHDVERANRRALDIDPASLF